MSGSYDRKDHYFEKAKEGGYRSRAAYKLLQLEKKYKFIKSGFKILDLGAWPGSWMQVAGELVGTKGLVVGVDLNQIENFKDSHIKIITGDARSPEVLDLACNLAGGKFDILLSDMSSRLTGIREADLHSGIQCAEIAFNAAGSLLKSGGSLVLKMFQSNEAQAFVKNIRPVFNKLIRTELEASRKTSIEFYVIGLGFIKR